MSRLQIRKTYKLFIGGAFPRTESGRYDRVARRGSDVSDVEAGSEAHVANVCRASRKDLRNAVVAAEKAQGGWAKRTAYNRSQILYRCAEMLETRAESVAARLVEGGLGTDEATSEVQWAIEHLVHYAGWCDKLTQVFGSVNPVSGPFFDFTTPEALGVVVLAAPPSSPLAGLVGALAPLLVAGNAAIAVVPSDSVAAIAAMELAEAWATSDLPGGVVNVLTGRRGELESWTGQHRAIDGLSWWAPSDDARKSLAVDGADSVKRVRLHDDPGTDAWRSDAVQSPYAILPFVEYKTAWHPVGT